MIRFQMPTFPPLAEIAPYFALAERDRWFSNSGPCHRLLTERLEERVGGGTRCLLVANGTLGLMIALRALTADRPPEATEVLVPCFTFIATVNAIIWTGLTPVFIDLDPDTWQPSPAAIGEALAARTGRVAAVLSASTFGTPPALELRARIEGACREHGVPLVVDSAAGFGARDESGASLGRQGDAELFSFHATKPFAIGEGGLLTTSNEALHAELARLVNFGIDEQRVLRGDFGLNAKLSELHAATGLAVLDRLDAILDARRARAARMRDSLEHAGYTFQAGNERSTWQFVPALAPSPAVRDAVLESATGLGIEVRTYFTPCHRFEPCARFTRIGRLEVSEGLADRMLSLPMSNDLTDLELERIIECCVAPA